MGIRYEDVEEACGYIADKLHECNEKIRKANGDVTESDTVFLDHLLHALKSGQTSMAMLESGYSNEGYSNDGYSNDGHMGGTSGRRYDNRYPGRSYARGRGSNAKRDSMGRYSRSDGQEEFIEQLREVMQDAPDDKTRREMERMITKLEG